MKRPQFVVIDAEMAGMRADQGLALRLPDLSRRQLQRYCDQDRVLRERQPLRKSERLQLGDVITVVADDPPVARPDPNSALVVRSATRHWIVLSKPPGQPTAPRNSEETATLANALVAAFPETGSIGHRALEPGLLHRLDNGTSGLIVAARTHEAFRLGTAALKSGHWHKRYLALVQGVDLPDAGKIEGRLLASPRSRRRVRVASELRLTTLSADEWLPNTLQQNRTEHGARDGQHPTNFVVRQRLSTSTLVEVAVHAAFRHQIRAHLSAAGWPLVNDVLYGGGAEPRLPVLRHALHAARVAWPGTAALEGFDVSEPLPDDLDALVRVANPAVP